MEEITDIKTEFGELFGEVTNTGTIFNALATITDSLGAALNVALRIIKLIVGSYSFRNF